MATVLVLVLPSLWNQLMQKYLLFYVFAETRDQMMLT